MRSKLSAGTLLGCLALTSVAAGARADDTIRTVEVVASSFRITMTDGRVLTGPDLVGAVLTIDDSDGDRILVRIDAVQPDPMDPSGEVTLHTFMAQDPTTGAWSNLCSPGPDGLAMGFPLAGTWTGTGEHLPSDTAFSFTCTSGAQGKCVRFGYRPWAAAADGTPLWDLHQACTRMVRADYCGDGTAHTRNGTPINVYDRQGIQEPDAVPDMSFEAGWGPNGAVCVARTRVPEIAGLDDLAGCARLQAAPRGPDCTEAAAEGALLFNQSF
jgi:hypothetical protein